MNPLLLVLVVLLYAIAIFGACFGIAYLIFRWLDK